MSDLKIVMITGGCGFIGSNFIHLLLKTGRYFVVNVDKMNYCASSKNIEFDYDPVTMEVTPADLGNYAFYQSDICNRDFILHIMKTHRVQIVYHFAAQSHVDQSFANSTQFVVDNVVGTSVLLECARQYMASGGHLEKFIHVSTDEVYGQRLEDGEELTIAPTNPYAASKAAAELMAKSYQTSYHLPLIITRSNNIYGPRQFWEKIVPKFLRYLSMGLPCPVYGSGQARRKYLYVDDVCQGYLMIMERGEIGKIYEMGSKNEYSALEMTQILTDIYRSLNSEAVVDTKHDHVEDRPFHDLRYQIDSRNMDELGWQETVPFDVGIRRTAYWYLKYAVPQEYWSYDEKILVGRMN